MTDLAAPSFNPQDIDAAMASPSPLATAAPSAPVSDAPKALSAPEFSFDDISEADHASKTNDLMALQANLRQASQQNPDDVAKALPLSQQLNLPVGTVQRNYNMLDQQQRFTQDYIDNLQKQFPNTAKWLKDPTNAAIAHDDIGNLTQIEHNSVASGLIDQTSLDWYNLFQTAKAHIGAATGNQEMVDQARKNLAFSKELKPQIGPDLTGNPIGGFLYGTAQGFASFAPEIAAGIVAGPLAGASAFGAGGFLTASGDTLASGGTETHALEGGALSGALNAAIFPVAGALSEKALSATPLPSWLSNTLAHGAIPMTAMGIGNAAIDTEFANTSPDKWRQFLHDLPTVAGESALQGIMFHAGTAGYGVAKDALLSRFDAKYAAAKAAQDQAPIIQSFNDAASTSKLRQRNPGLFNTFAQGATEGTSIKTLWLEPDAMKEAGVSPEDLAKAIPSAAADIVDAVSNNHAIRFSGADFATALAGTDIGKALQPHLKTDPNGMSQSEADAFMKGGGAEEFNKEMDRAQTAETGNHEFEQSAKAVEDQIAARYAATGRFSKDANAAVARLGSFYRVLAKDYGITPEEAYRLHGPKISGSDMHPGAAAFDGSKVEQPQPVSNPDELPGNTGELENVQPEQPVVAAPIEKPPVTPENQHLLDQQKIVRDLQKQIRTFGATRSKSKKTELFGLKSQLKTENTVLRDMLDKAGIKRGNVDNLVRKPTTLRGAIRKLGGVSDPDGWLRAMELDKDPRFKGVINDNGLPPDEMIVRLQELGHFPQDDPNAPSELTSDDLYQALKAEQDNQNHYSDKEMSLVEDAHIRALADHHADLTAAAIDNVQAVAKERGIELNDSEALEVAKLEADGVDLVDAIVHVNEKAAIQGDEDFSEARGVEPDIFEDISFDLPAPEAKRQEAPAQEAGGTQGQSAHGEGGGSATPDRQSERPLIDTQPDSAADIARRTADERLKGSVPQKGLNDLDLFDDNGRAIDSQGEFFQKSSDLKTDTPEFKNWFGDSKVVDKQGKPLVVYHGSPNEIEVFDASKGGSSTGAKSGEKGFFFTDREKTAKYYSRGNNANIAEAKRRGQNPNIVNAYLSLKNPLVFDMKGKIYREKSYADIIDEAKNDGYDGVIIKNTFDGGEYNRLDALMKGRIKGENIYVAFHPEQIKSIRTFDPNDPRILHQSNNASYNPTTREIWLGPKANLTSMLHEEGHHFLNVYTKLAAEEGAPQRVRDIADAALRSLGVAGETPEERNTNWHGLSLDEQRAGHEQWARGFERYLFRGKAPSIEQQTAFDAFRGWLKSVYGSIKDFVRMNPEAGKLNEELRSVMDRMLATDQEIEYARRVRNFGSLFTSAEQAGMTQDQYRAYQNLDSQSIQEATAELQARSLRDLALTRRLHEDSVREIKNNAREKRKDVQDEVTQEVMNEPVNRARTFLKRGEVNGEAVDGVHRLDIDALKATYGDGQDALWRKLQGKFGKHGIIGKGGIHPDDLAQQFGFHSGDQMIRAMLEQPSTKEHIANLTDKRMIERYGDLTDPRTIQRRADQAVHNEARIRSVATELNAIRKALGKQKILKDAAEQYAKSMIDRQKAGDINPNIYATAAAKAARVAEKAIAKGNLPEVAEALRNQLVNEIATKLAYEALDDIRKIRTNARRYEKASVRKRIGTDIEQIDALLDQYDMRASAVERKDIRQQSLLEWYQSQIDADYEPTIDPKILQSQQKTHYAELPLPDLRSLDTALRSIEATARTRKEIRIEGKKIALNTAVDELTARMAERGEKFTTQELLNKPRLGVDSIFKVGLDRFESALRAGVATLKPQDFRANQYDLHDIEGPFHKYLFNPLFDRNYWKGQQLSDISHTFQEIASQLGPDWHKSLYDIIPNNTLIDKAAGDGSFRRLTRGEMIGVARHVGNESNFAKLTKGAGWEPEDVWRFLNQNMRESDWKAVQAEWDAFEKHWPEIEAMIRRLGGEVPEKIPVRSFKTKYGEMRGGYAPIEYDPVRSKLAKRLGDVKADASQSIGKSQYYKATTTMNNSLRNRSEGYTDIVNLDYHYMTRRLHETIHDLAYREAILDAKKILEHPEFRNQFQRTFGLEEYENLQKFITNVRDLYKRDNDMDGFEKAIQYSRQGIILNGVGYRLTTVLKHGSSAGLKSLGFIEGPGRKYLLARAARMATGNASADIAEARERFPEINARLQRMDRDFSAGEHSLYDKEDWRTKNNRFSHAMIAWSDALTAIPTAHAAYDWAITEGVPKNLGGSGKPMTHEQAVRFANSVVRQAHGSALESARSNFLHEKGMASLLGMIYQFQNNTFGQLADIKDKAFAAGSRYQSNPALAGRLAASLVAPAVVAYLVGHGLDKKPWYEQIGMAIGGELASTVPLLRDGWAMVESMAEGRNWKDSALQLPPVRVAGDIVQAVTDAVRETKGHSTRIIQDAGNAIGEAFHIAGLGQAGKTLQYANDIHTGKQHPANIGAAVMGATIGPPHATRH